jgi:inositol transport system substrate-binding protein
MKKFTHRISFVATVFLTAALLLSACGTASSTTSPSTSAASAQPSTATSTSNIQVAYICKNTVDAFHQTINAAAKKSLDELVAKGTIKSWQLYDGQTDPATQVTLLETAITNGANFVVFLPAEAAGSDPVVTKCADEKIPCLVVNSKTTSTDAKATAFVGSDDVFAGEMMGKYITEKCPNGGMYLHMQGVIGNSAQIDRGKGIANTLGADSKFKMAGEYACDWSADKAVSNATDAITTYGDKIVAIVCDNDDMSSAVQNYCNSIGRKDIYCIGVDGNQGPLGMVKAGTLGATVLQDGASQVSTAIGLIPDIIAGKTVEKSTKIPFVLVTTENVDKYLTK